VLYVAEKQRETRALSKTTVVDTTILSGTESYPRHLFLGRDLFVDNNPAIPTSYYTQERQQGINLQKVQAALNLFRTTPPPKSKSWHQGNDHYQLDLKIPTNRLNLCYPKKNNDSTRSSTTTVILHRRQR
jgi:hypothetical protein